MMSSTDQQENWSADIIAGHFPMGYQGTKTRRVKQKWRGFTRISLTLASLAHMRPHHNVLKDRLVFTMHNQRSMHTNSKLHCDHHC